MISSCSLLSFLKFFGYGFNFCGSGCLGGLQITTSGLFGNWPAMRGRVWSNQIEIFWEFPMFSRN